MPDRDWWIGLAALSVIVAVGLVADVDLVTVLACSFITMTLLYATTPRPPVVEPAHHEPEHGLADVERAR